MGSSQGRAQCGLTFEWYYGLSRRDDMILRVSLYSPFVSLDERGFVLHNIRWRCFVFTFLHFLTPDLTWEAFMVGSIALFFFFPFFSTVADTGTGCVTMDTHRSDGRSSYILNRKTQKFVSVTSFSSIGSVSLIRVKSV